MSLSMLFVPRCSHTVAPGRYVPMYKTTDSVITAVDNHRQSQRFCFKSAVMQAEAHCDSFMVLLIERTLKDD